MAYLRLFILIVLFQIAAVQGDDDGWKPRWPYCAKFDFEPEKCIREHDCYYSCMDNACMDNKYDHGEISNNDTCLFNTNRYCYNPCRCAKHGYFYNAVTQHCNRRLLECNKADFGRHGCLRQDHFYYNNGSLCVHLDETWGNCEVTRELGINWAGEEVTDRNGILYEAHEKYKRNNWHSVNIGKTRKTGVLGIEEDYAYEEELYNTYSFRGRGDGCVGVKFYRWELPAGNYEAVWKFAEFETTKIGKRVMTLTFAQQRVVPAFDPIALAPPKHAISLVVPFRAFYKKGDRYAHVQVDGFPPVRLDNHYKDEFIVCDTQRGYAPFGDPSNQKYQCDRVRDEVGDFKNSIVSAQYAARFNDVV